MKKLLLYILFIPLLTSGQTFFSLKDKETNEPIPYANIWRSNVLITASDSLGNFQLNKITQNPIYKITSVNYKTLENIQLKESIITLEKQTIELNNVLINSKVRKNRAKLGNVKNGDIGVCAEMKDSISNSLIAKFFPNNNQDNLYLEKIKFKCLTTDKNRIVSFLIYDTDESGAPKELLNTENIICNIKKGHNINEVDISNLNILFPEKGVFIVVNYLFLEQNKIYGLKNKDWFYYEPSFDANEVNQFNDTWYYNSKWNKIETYSLNIQLTLTD